MVSYGFHCDQYRMPNKSMEAFMLGCNAVRPDGRYQFVQLLYDNDNWIVDFQETYVPEHAELVVAADDPELALSAYIREEMQSYAMFSSGGIVVENFDDFVTIETGTLWHERQMGVRGMCGVVIDGQADDAMAETIRLGCEMEVLRTIMKLSQPSAASPFRAAGASEVEWNSRIATISSGDFALVVEGNYSFAKDHTSCLLTNDCCLGDGSIYLDSCRIPTEMELRAVKFCLAAGLRRRSEEYSGCLRDAGVSVGCEDQADGSRMCY